MVSVAQRRVVRRDCLNNIRLAMMDIFADAISDAALLSDASQPMLSTALSQDNVLDDSMGVVVQHIDLIDDDEGTPGTVNAQVPDNATRYDMVSHNVDCNSHDACQPPLSKRRKVACKPPQLHEVPYSNVNEVMCVFIKRDNKSCPVPLWDQYSVTWHGQCLETSRAMVNYNDRRGDAQISEADSKNIHGWLSE